ncbi:amidohydrolase family protein [Kibdelosporangium philippinense]|uniref:Amidohydrolase family protein n=1 Tax=Kibdelosporangium philippinense TaxID=211113 RepID=A0ABS8Z2U2_9PSEU|nr:amidohydrolase family protein [Kibdelosporangium philippinense]MCE7002258.1 amidohydrolase family protein [Kibdelosporangium philippinense]
MSGKLLLRGARILSMDDSAGEFDGDVLIADGRIAEVAPRITTVADEVVDYRDHIVLPGLVDCHVHVWQSLIRGIASGCWGREYFGLVHPLSGRIRPPDLRTAELAGATELLTHGVTTAFDFCHTVSSEEHAEAAINGLTESGIRALFGYSLRARPEAGPQYDRSLQDHIATLQDLSTRDERVRVAVALNNIDHVSPEQHAAEVRAVRALGLRASLHSNLPNQVSQSLPGPDILWVHCGQISDEELDSLSSQGGFVVATPETEAAQMGVNPIVGRALRHGVPVVFGTDVPAAFNGSMLSQLRTSHALEHLLAAQTGERPRLDARRLLRMATIGGAKALGMGAEIGSLTPGKLADLLVIWTGPFGLGDADAADHVVFQSTARDIKAVYVGGVPVVREGVPLNVDLPALREAVSRARDWIRGTAPDSPWTEIDDQARRRYEAGQGNPAMT